MKLYVLQSRTGETCRLLQQYVRVENVYREEREVRDYLVPVFSPPNDEALVLLLGYMKKVERLHHKIPTYNLHPGSLPSLKGRDPQLRALAERREWTAVTLHTVNDKIDEGSIVAEIPFRIREEHYDDPTLMMREMKQVGALLCASFFIGQGVEQCMNVTAKSAVSANGQIGGLGPSCLRYDNTQCLASDKRPERPKSSHDRSSQEGQERRSTE